MLNSYKPSYMLPYIQTQGLSFKYLPTYSRNANSNMHAM